MPTIPLGQRIKISLSAIVCFVVVIAFLLSLPVLFSISMWVLLAISVLALLLGLLLNGALRVLFGKKKNRSVFKSVGVFFCLLTIATALPVYYLVYKVQVDPPLLPQATLSNGEKVVDFQGMVHVGMESFYKSVVYDLEEALSDGYRLYYEGVQPSPGEGDAWFAEQLAGGGDLAENYKALADACGVKFQTDYFGLMALDAQQRPEHHVAADVTSLEMKKEYDRLMATDPAFAEQQANRDTSSSTDTADPVAVLLDWHASATDEQKKLIGILCRGAFAIALGDQSEHEPGPLDKVILDFRNRKLAQRILADDSQRLYITYGAAHLPGVLATLQAADPAWQIITVKWMRGMAAPEHLEGTLPPMP
ncbi:hypothetical protein [Alcanivorax sp.]|uniref:hypothetical protein n=1 Tax=Alcanivorax sp. TaxID=1872427 RepID=UPI000C4715F0|nr:hypothetical protein [Alcanivorax sp.]MBQ26183.1 hypothetical protein [Alcanivorax sp.]